MPRPGSLKRRGIGCILRCGRERLGCSHIVTHGSKRLAAVGEQRAALAIGTVVEGGGVGLGGLGIHTQVHQGVAAQMVGLAHNLAGGLCRTEHLGGSGIITRAISGAALLDQLAIQGSPLLLVNDLDVDDLVAGTQLRNHIEALDRGAKDGVAGVEVMLGTQAEVELRTRGIGIHRTCHGKRAVDVAVTRLVANSPLMQ